MARANVSANSTAAGANDSESRLVKWSHATVAPEIAVQWFDGVGRGLGARGSIPNGNLIISIPHSYLLNPHTIIRHVALTSGTKLPDHYANIVLEQGAQNDDAVADIYRLMTVDEMTAMSSFQLVALYLCLESHRATSFWKPFLDLLPLMETFDLTPLVWQVQRDDALKYIDLLPPLVKAHAMKVYHRYTSDLAFLRTYLTAKVVATALCQDPAPLVLLYLDNFLHMWMCINSRCLYMELRESNDKHDNFTMAPFVDFINHTDTDHCKLAIDSKGFHVFTTNAYQEGDQVYLSYGPHSNGFLMCEYGFTIPSNRWNDVDISSPIVKRLSEKQKLFLEENGYFDDYTIGHDGLSYRTEIALATLQESLPASSRKLRAFILGVSEGQAYAKGTRNIVREIMKEMRFRDDLQDDKDRIKRVIGSLHHEMKQLMERV